MTYQEMKQKHQDEFNKFPKGFAFTQEQLIEEMEKLGVASEDDLIGIAGGTGFIRKTDLEEYRGMNRKHLDNLKEAMRDYDFSFSAFLYELNNHEYIITYETDDAIDALGLTRSDFDANPVLLKALKAARKHIEDTRGLY